jgi:trigger factor
LNIVDERYGKGVRDEVIEELIRASLQGALAEQQLQPAGPPVIEDVKANKGEPLQYVVSFEIYPQIALADFKQLNINKPIATIDDADIGRMIEKIRVQFKEWEKVERPAEVGDKLLMDFVGKMDNVPFKGGSAEKVQIVLGDKQFIPGFETSLMGVTAGEHRDITVTFPEQYHAPDLAGKPAIFSVTVHEVLAPKLPELDEAFFKRMEVKDGTLESFREQIRSHMEREMSRTVRFKLKNQVFDQLLSLNKVELPKALIEQELENLHRQIHGGKEVEKSDHSAHDHPELEDEAKKRVNISLILGEVIKQHDIKVDPEKVIALLEEAAQSYQDPNAVRAWFKQQKNTMANFEAMAIEEQVLDFLLEQASIAETPITYSELMQVETSEQK